MAREPRKIKAIPGSELANLLAEASAMPLVIEKDGDLYRLERMDKEAESEHIFEGYDPEKVRQAIVASAGSWADLDADAIIADIYRAREEGSRPPTRP